MHDDFDAPARAPSDFPADPLIHHDLLLWALVTIGLIVLACGLTVLYKEAERRVRAGLGEAIDSRARLVLKALSSAAHARQDEQMALTQAASDAVTENFGQTLKLSRELNAVIGKLNTALEGTREEEAAPHHSGLHHGGLGPVAAGGTVIQIAVHNGAPGEVSPAASHSEVSSHAEDVNPQERSESLWRAVQKLFGDWKNLNVVTAAFRAAQQQLMFSERWIDPRVEAKPGQNRSGGSLRKPEAER